ncbi:hypothetical protein GTC6_14794 [Gordonia terrae C-6]|uniref:Uncharacterized protein n=1 Tax=Gordonia terrae C-6 TaxID=1316928 RepID=R7Y7R9_9ACTN|nr:hypothetical protein [Gordonia terrae]EON32078.1 hypothetical protein GTC6_14794 [Gordonia terrae C-6]
MRHIRTLTAVAAAATALALAGCTSDPTDTPPQSPSASSSAATGSTSTSAAGESTAAPGGTPGAETGNDAPDQPQPTEVSGPAPDQGAPPAAERPTDPNEPSAAGTYCGAGYNGLAVWAFGPDCATAQSVSSALGAQRAAGAQFPITVTVAGQNWGCYQGGTTVPYMECSGLGAVRLTS